MTGTGGPGQGHDTHMLWLVLWKMSQLFWTTSGQLRQQQSDGSRWSDVSRSVPHAKSHTIDRYISNIRHYLTDTARFYPTQSAPIMTDLSLRPAPITVKATGRTWIEQPSHDHGDVEAL